MREAEPHNDRPSADKSVAIEVYPAAAVYTRQLLGGSLAGCWADEGMPLGDSLSGGGRKIAPTRKGLTNSGSANQHWVILQNRHVNPFMPSSRFYIH